MNSRFDISEKTWKQKDINKIPDLLNQSDRKITRNQKRRHDEINHVQMVTFVKYIVILYIGINFEFYFTSLMLTWIQPQLHWKKSTRQ